MRTWTAPTIPSLPGTGQPPRLFNTASGRLEHPPLSNEQATLYVCGITPYDATHLGHAATYLAFDVMQRAWIDAGIETVYAQNITDVDDPLLERAKATGVEWKHLADDQISLFRSDIFRLGMLPPQHYVAVTERIEEIAGAVARLRELGLAYEVPTADSEGDDLYFDVRQAQVASEWRLGDVAPYDAQLMRQLSAERGGDPQREGKRDPLDPLLWRAAREGEPSWPSEVGVGRPGWHIECSVIAAGALGNAFTVQGGGADLVFPHHEFTAAHATALSGTPLAHAYCHVGLISYQGHKMSKSRGNLVFVSALRHEGTDPMAIRLALLAHHYRADWEWTQEGLDQAVVRLAAWRAATSAGSGPGAEGTVSAVRAALADDLRAPDAVAAVDAWVAAQESGAGDDTDAPGQVLDLVDALLGVRLRE